MSEVQPVSVNWHLWPICNYHCKFCFARFEGVEAVSKEVALDILGKLRDSGVEKITFAGGEPTLCPHLVELLEFAKDSGLTTMIVTNGTRLNNDFLERVGDYLDWVAISVDSAREDTERRLGRGVGGHVRTVRRAAVRVKDHGIRLKINTLVTSLNWREDMHSYINELSPERWKVFQFLPIQGENDEHAPQLSISKGKFRSFVQRHEDLCPVAEDNDAMTGSYVMLDPTGRVFQNSNGYYRFSRPICDVGFMSAVWEVGWDEPKFMNRGGHYAWSLGGMEG